MRAPTIGPLSADSLACILALNALYYYCSLTLFSRLRRSLSLPCLVSRQRASVLPLTTTMPFFFFYNALSLFFSLQRAPADSWMNAFVSGSNLTQRQLSKSQTWRRQVFLVAALARGSREHSSRSILEQGLASGRKYCSYWPLELPPLACSWLPANNQ